MPLLPLCIMYVPWWWLTYIHAACRQMRWYFLLRAIYLVEGLLSVIKMNEPDSISGAAGSTSTICHGNFSFSTENSEVITVPELRLA